MIDDDNNEPDNDNDGWNYGKLTRREKKTNNVMIAESRK